MSKETGKTRRDLVELLETDYEDKDEAVLLLERAFKIKKAKEAIEAEYDEVKEDLAAMQKLSGLEGLRHNHIAFVLTHMEGRETVDTQKFTQELTLAGIDPLVVNACMKKALKRGDGYYKREVVDLTPKEKKDRGKGKGEWE